MYKWCTIVASQSVLVHHLEENYYWIISTNKKHHIMKGAVFTVLCAVALTRGAVVVNQNGCPVDFQIEKLLPHQDCNKFFQCLYGNLFEMSCAPGLHFSTAKKRCDFPNIANCQNKITETNYQYPSDNQAATICASSRNGLMVPHERCDFYYSCLNGKPIAKKCAVNLLYNEDEQRCDWAINVNCANRALIIGGAPAIPFQTINGIANEDNEENSIEPGQFIPSETSASTICATAGSEGLLVAHENCNRFYKCSFGLPVAMLCPGILLYDPSKEQCEWPQTVECGDRVIPENKDDENTADDWNGQGTGNSDPSEAPAICAAEGSDHTYIAHENCNQYYKCWAGFPVALDCPLGYLFNPNKNYCDFPYNVVCGMRMIPENVGNKIENNDVNAEDDVPSGSNNNDPSEASAICEAAESDGVLVAHENCNQFYKCSFGLPVAMICPGNLMFDPTKDRCEYRDTVDCGERAIPEYNDNDNGGNEWSGNGAGNDDPSQAPSICAAEGSDHIYIAHENCNQYYKCWAGKPVPLDCPSGYLFNPNKDYCDFPYNVVCGDRIIPDNWDIDNDNQGGNNDENPEDDVPIGNNYDDPSEAPSICGTDGSDGVLVAHENCNQFYKCAFGIPVAMSCSGSLLFDPSKDRCEWRDTVQCGDRLIPEYNENNNGGNEWTGNGAGNDDPSQASTICAAEESDHIYIAHENCNQYYKCWAGNPVALDCPPGYLFNPNKDYCDFPYNVICGNRVIPDNWNSDSGNNDQGESNDVQAEEEIPIGNNHDDPSEAPAICKTTESDGVLVAHENCNQFYKCTYGIPVALICPGTLLFDPSRDRCEWPKTVDCGQRIIPEYNDNNNGGNEWTGNGAGNDDPSQAPAICAAEGSDHIYIAHENCNQYYKCWAGNPVALNCPSGYLFNPNKDYCDFPYNVACGDRVIPENWDSDSGNDNQGGNNDGNTDDDDPIGNNYDDPSEAPTICETAGSDGVLVAHENCNQFYKCAFGLPVAMLCSGNLLFDPTKDRCEWRDTVKCGDRLVPEYDDKDNDQSVWEGNGAGNDDPSQAPSICAAEGSDHTYIAHENCNQYYKCWAGVPVAMDCPSDHFFNPKKDYCDFPQNVDCGSRLIVA